jgi:uncharacterized glyoxalase superfamily protein PhnB
MQTIFPAIRYQDARAAIAWLERAFGFSEHVVVPGPGDSIAHAQLELESNIVMLGSVRDDELRLKTPRELGAGTQGVYVVIGDVDEHCKRARAAGAEVVRGPEDTPYGSREYTARDLEGHLWSFGTYQPHDAA